MQQQAALETIAINESRLDETEVVTEQMEQRPQTSTAVVGILVTILIFLLMQTAGIAFWAGGQSSKQDATTTQLNEVKQQLQFIQVQYQVVASKLAALEATTEKRK